MSALPLSPTESRVLMYLFDRVFITFYGGHVSVTTVYSFVLLLHHARKLAKVWGMHLFVFLPLSHCYYLFTRQLTTDLHQLTVSCAWCFFSYTDARDTLCEF